MTRIGINEAPTDPRPDVASNIEINMEHDWRQFVIIPVTQKPDYALSGAIAFFTVPLFCARCFRCNRYYTQELAYGANEAGVQGQLNLPQYGCRVPDGI